MDNKEAEDFVRSVLIDPTEEEKKASSNQSDALVITSSSSIATTATEQSAVQQQSNADNTICIVPIAQQLTSVVSTATTVTQESTGINLPTITRKIPRQHVCHLCCKVFSRGTNLRRHLNTFHLEKDRLPPFQCQICQKRFKEPSSLKKHLKSRCKGPTGVTAAADSLTNNDEKIVDAAAPNAEKSVTGSAKAFISLSPTHPDVQDIFSSLVPWLESRIRSPKSIDLFKQDLRYILGLLLNYSSKIKPPLTFRYFASSRIVQEVIDLARQRLNIKRGARLYSLVAVMDKCVMFIKSKQPSFVVESETLIAKMKTDFNRQRKQESSLSHQRKNAVNSGKWLSLNEFRQLARDLQREMNELDSLCSEQSESLAKKYQSLLLTAFHVLAIPQRQQVYKHLRLGTTFVRIDVVDIQNEELVSNATSSKSSSLVNILNDNDLWMIVNDPADLQQEQQPSSSDTNLSAVSEQKTVPIQKRRSLKTHQIQELPLPSQLCIFVNRFLKRWRPLLLNTNKKNGDHQYFFMGQKGQAPLSNIYSLVQRTCKRLTDGRKMPSPHLFRSMVSTFLHQSSTQPEKMIDALATTMLNSVDTQRKSYIAVDRVGSAQLVQNALSALLSVPANNVNATTTATVTAKWKVISHAKEKKKGEEENSLVTTQPDVEEQDIDSSSTEQNDHEEEGKSKPTSQKVVKPTSDKKQRRPWIEKEVEALEEGVRKYGASNWCAILKDKELALKLAGRSNIDLKDKYRLLMRKSQKSQQGQ